MRHALPTSARHLALTFCLSLAWLAWGHAASAQSAYPVSLTLSPAAVTGGTNSTATLTLNEPAPAGTTAKVLSSSPAVTVPGFVTVPTGASSVRFTVATTPVTSVTAATLTAYNSKTVTATLTVATPAAASVGLSPASVTGGSPSTGTVTLSGPAPTGGTAVSLTSDSTSATVPSSVTVPAGSTSATFAVATSAVSSATTATISAAAGGATKTATLTINPTTTGGSSLSGLVLNAFGVIGGTSGTGTVTLSATPQTNIAVTLSSDNPTVVSVPTQVIVLANQTSATFSYIGGNVQDASVANLSASYNGVVLTTPLTTYPTIVLNVAATGETATGQGKITLFWTGVPGASGYNVYRCLSGTTTYTKIASNASTPDASSVLTNSFQYTDASLTIGGQYCYYVVAVGTNGVEGALSNTDGDVASATAVPWDTGDPSQIIPAASAMAGSALIPDPEDPDAVPNQVGLLTVAAPDGAVYMGNFPDGSAPQVLQPVGTYDATTDAVDYNDGSVAPMDPSPMLAAQGQAASALVSPLASVGETLLPALPPTGIVRKVASQPGMSGFSGVVGLPNVADSTQFSLNVDYTGHTDPVTNRPYIYWDDADIYTGGHVEFPSGVKQANPALQNGYGEIDAGLQFSTYPYPNQAWQPYIFGATDRAVILGGTGGKLVPNTYKVYITGQVRMAFLTPLNNAQVRSKTLLLNYGTPYGELNDVYPPCSIQAKHYNGAGFDKTYNESNITLMCTGGSARHWLKQSYDPMNPQLGSNQFVIKRGNSISQTINPQAHPYAYAPNGPGGGFAMDGSYIIGAAWGDGDQFGQVLLGPSGGTIPWTDDSSITSFAGAYPLDSRFIKFNVNNAYFWETNINMRTSLGILPGF